MESIYILDLTAQTMQIQPYDVQEEGDYGRGLALRLLREHVPLHAGRFSPENALIMVPGLFAGCAAPSAGRMTILAKGSETSVQVCNITGNLPQKLGSLGVCGLVIKGADPRGNAVLEITADGASLHHLPGLDGKYTGDVIAELKAQFGREAAIVGTGIAGDLRLPLSTVFCTYPDGEPEYNCPRNGFGDIQGSKGLRAVVVTGKDYFARECADATAFRAAGKQLAAQILKNDICSSALPAYGSITLIQLLRNGGLPEQPPVTVQPVEPATPKAGNGRTNLCCAPMCVIGCLNRHSSTSGEHYDSPDQSELATALKNCFAIEDGVFLRQLQHRLRNLCLVSPEFVTAARSYFVATDTEPSKERILSLVDEIEHGTDVGKLVASRTEGIAAAYPDRPELKTLLDQPAIADENQFEVQLAHRSERFRGVSDLDLLYSEIFVLENLGICLFASFALVNNRDALDLLAELFRYKTGAASADGDALLLYAAQCKAEELAYLRENGAESPQTNIPAFTKVLYRYFAKQQASEC